MSISLNQLVRRLANQRVYRAGSGSSVSVRRRNIRDLLAGLLRRSLVLHLGMSEIVHRYRNTVLGPLWMTLSLSVFLTALAIVGGALFELPLREYLPFLCAGVVIWTFIAAIVNESGQIFIAAPLDVVAYGLPTSVFIYSFLVKQYLLFLHNLLIFVILALIFEVSFYLTIHWFIAGLIIYLPFCIGMSILMSIISIRYRDLPEMVASILQVLFFATPVMWKPELLIARGREYVLDWNPLYYMIEVLRLPLMGHEIPVKILIVASVISLSIFFLGILVFANYRHRISYYR